MRVRVLGPLEISDGTECRQVGAAKQRSLLAALVVRAGRPVSVDRLIEELWGGQSPQTAVNLIHVYVAALRRALNDRDGAVLRTQPPGYQLVLSDDDLDLRRFERLVDCGRKVLADGDSQAASGILAEAQRLWRGQPFADVPATAAVEAEANRLEQLRLAGLEARIEADLDLGRHAALVAELHTLTGTHPLLERFWAQLMLAFYRSGRQAEALAAYQRLYKLLDDELGIKPTRYVRDLHQQILNCDAALDLAAAKPQQAGNVVPRQLPAGFGEFIGRQDHLATLDTLLPVEETHPAPAVVISAITGTAGIGKTALAVHWAHRIAGRFPDGQLYVNLRGFDPIGRPVSAADAIRGFLDALGVSPERIPAELDAQAALYRSLLADRRLLVVFDNARDADQVRPLLPGSPGCLALITSRHRLESLIAAQAARPVQVDLLSTEEAYDLLAARLGKDRVAAEPESVRALITSCARLPLALAIVAARAAINPHFPLAALATELAASRTSLEPFTSRDTSTDLRAVFSWSYHQLDTNAQQLFRLLGLHPGPDITVLAAASLTGQPLTHVHRAVSELCRAHLLTEHVPGRYTFHDLLRAYAHELVHSHDPDAERHTAIGRLLDHYLHTAHAAARLLNPHRDLITLDTPEPGVTVENLADYEQAHRWFTAEQPVLLGVIDYAAGAEYDVHTWQLVWTLADFLDGNGHWHEQVALCRTALDAVIRLEDQDGQARMHRNLADAYGRLGNLDEARAHFHYALDLHGQFGDQAGQARIHQSLGILLERQDRPLEARGHAQHALNLFQAAGHQVGTAMALNQLGWYHAELGDHQKALDCCQQALHLQQELGDYASETATWDSLGYIHHQLGNHQEAIDCYQRALNQSRNFGRRYDEARVLLHLGDTHHATGDHDATRATWQEALGILEELDHSDAELVRVRIAKLPPTAKPTT